MNLAIQIKEAIFNLISAKMRSVLAVLGILVGTASVVAMISGGELATRQVLLQFKALGTNLLSVSVMSQDRSNSASGAINIKTAFNLQKVSPDIDQVAPYASTYANIEFKGKRINGGIAGVTEDFFDITKLKLQQGRFIYYVDNYAHFCLIGSGIYKQMQQAGGGNPIGKQIQLGENIFTIVGLLAPWEENAFIDIDTNNTIFIPVKTAKLLSKYADISNIVVKIKPKTNIPALENQIQNYFASHLKGKKLYIRNPQQFLDSMAKQSAILTIFLGFIGGISLLVGGIGIMNIMLVSVTERKREIGIRKAIGAKARDIQSLFLVEAIILSSFGGILGIILGELVTLTIALLKNWHFTLFFYPIIIGFTVSSLAGIFFGFYPAHKASKLDPIETLRGEM